MKRLLALTLMVGWLLGTAAPAVRADYPKPSLYQIAWELKFTHSMPKRVVVNVPDVPEPRAFWYMTYTVTNPTDKEVTFLPIFEMLTPDGKTTRSDFAISGRVLAVIRAREKNVNLMSQAQIEGQLKIGEDQAKDGMAIWPEPAGRMGQFSIFIQGLSGETAKVKGPDGQEITLRKTLQLNYIIRGDEVYPGDNKVDENPSAWVMR